MYDALIRPILFSLGDPERTHERMLVVGELLQRLGVSTVLRAMPSATHAMDLSTEIFGTHLPHPIGLAAGFDKDARIVPLLASLGFAAIEVGSITREPQIGNPRPRIFRLEEDGAIINRMGFPSRGMSYVEAKLRALPKNARPPLLGINIGKNKNTSLACAGGEMREVLLKLRELGDYFVVNVSSPNTKDLRQLQDRERLTDLLGVLTSEAALGKPIALKLSPDLSRDALDDAVEVALGADVSAIIATNTTITREGLHSAGNESGGLSGRPLFSRSREVIQHLSSALEGRIPIIAAGGITTGQDVFDMLRLGASMVQVYTSVIYRGPRIVQKLLVELTQSLAEHGATSLSDLQQEALSGKTVVRSALQAQSAVKY